MLKVEQLALDVKTAAVAAQRSAGCDHAVAGDDDGDWIPVVRHTDGAVGVGMANGLGDVTVAASLAVWNFEQCMPAGQLELGSTKIEWERELAALSRKIFVEFTQIGREGCFRFTQFCRLGSNFSCDLRIRVGPILLRGGEE